MTATTDSPYDPPTNSPLQRTTKRVVIDATVGVALATEALVSTLRGQNLSLTGGARALSPARRISSAIALAFLAKGLVTNLSTLKERVAYTSNNELGVVNCSDKQLKSNVAGGLIAVGLAAVPLLRGKTIWRQHPLSRIGRAEVALAIGVAAHSAFESGRELYKRSPKAQQRMSMAKMMVPLMTDQLIAKVTRRESPQSSMEAMLSGLASQLPDGVDLSSIFGEGFDPSSLNGEARDLSSLFGDEWDSKNTPLDPDDTP